MTPSNITNILDLAKRARNNGDIFNPMFVSPPGLGKTEICHQWAINNGYNYLYFPANYLERPDFLGLPVMEKDENGLTRTKYATPAFWPTEGKWLLVLEELNRADSSVMNGFMELLTKRTVNDYKLPEQVIICSCINPENESHDVNAMDAAVRDRFEIFDVVYDKQTFLTFMKENNWNETLQMFVETGTWNYSVPEEIGNADGAKYLSPRTFSKMNTAMNAGIPAEFEMIVFQAILGKNVGKAFFQFKNNEMPVTYQDIVTNPKQALKRLQKYSDPKNYKNSYISLTVKSITDDGNIDDETLLKVLGVIPADQAVVLIRNLEFKRDDNTSLKLFDRLVKDYPDTMNKIKGALKKAETV